MADDLRPSPRHKPVSLFVTCMVDALYPPVGIGVVRILDRLGVPVSFPLGQTCCGQPAFNGGFREDAAAVARQFLRAFAGADVIVTPSGSCAAMVRHYYPELFADDPEWRERAAWAAAITWEFTEYLVDGLGVTDLGVTLPPTRVAFHDACHGLRELGLKQQARALVGQVGGVTIVEGADEERCCGFGGLFAVKMAAISSAMLKEKLAAVEAVNADVIVTGDTSCMTQINGGLARRGSALRAVHIAEFLARGLPG